MHWLGNPPAGALPRAVVTYQDGAARVVLDPDGLTWADDDAVPRLAHRGVERVGRETLTWAWGYVPASAPTPRVRFASWTGLRVHRAGTRRLSARLWAAQAPGRWSRVLLDEQ